MNLTYHRTPTIYGQRVPDEVWAIVDSDIETGLACVFGDESKAKFFVRACNSYYPMLEALKEIATVFEDTTFKNYPDMEDYLWWCVGTAKAAISKAEA